jgi:hypothetical protein
MALDPGDRLRFFMSLEATTPEIAALVIRTVVEDVRPAVARAYYDKLEHLIKGADPLQVYILAARYVNTATALKERLAIHQFMASVLRELLDRAGYTYSYVRFDQGVQFFGTLARRTVVVCPNALGEEDMVVYRTRDIRPKHKSTNGRWPEVEVQQVELKDMSLPESFGL